MPITPFLNGERLPRQANAIPMFCASKHWRPLLAAGIKADVLDRE
jgi:hypothetical protein